MILLTGGTGSLGNALIPALLERGQKVSVLSRDEYKQALMKEKYPDVSHWFIGDVRDEDRVKGVVNHCDPETIIHAAALKRVDSSTNPSEITKTNIGGTWSIITAAKGRKILLISSDKAVEPLNAYGVSKAMAECLVLNVGGSVIRYGNVLWSRGSVLETWERTGKPTMSAPNMTRFWLTLKEAVSLVIEALVTMQPGKVIIPSLRAAPVETLAEAAGYPAPYTYTGLRPGGEKMHEVLEPGGRNSEKSHWHDLDTLKQMIREGRPT